MIYGEAAVGLIHRQAALRLSSRSTAWRRSGALAAGMQWALCDKPVNELKT